MSELEPNPEAEREYERAQLLGYADEALTELAPKYLGDEGAVLRNMLTVKIREEDERGEAVPLTEYNRCSKQLIMHIEPNSTLEYAAEMQDDINHGVEAADIAKILVGAGIARCIVGWKASKSMGTTEEQQNRYKELLCSKEELWRACDAFDDQMEPEDQAQVKLRRVVERLGDGQIIRINVLRFAFGASLTHLSDSMSLQQNMVEHMRSTLIDTEKQRQANLRFNIAWLERGSAFAIYDDATPELELAFSFPMTPGEELQSFAAENPK